MKREDFIKIIRLRSFWHIDKRKGNFKLPNGSSLSEYVERLVRSQLDIDNLAIKADGNITTGSGGEWDTEKKEFTNYTILCPFAENETCTYEEHERRIKVLVREITG